MRAPLSAILSISEVCFALSTLTNTNDLRAVKSSLSDDSAVRCKQRALVYKKKSVYVIFYIDLKSILDFGRSIR